MRQALRMVRDQLGPEAVILTSKRTANGVEVTAAIDFDAARVEAQAQVATAAPAHAHALAAPRSFRPEEFAPTDPADDDVQHSVFARLQAEMARETAGARGATGGRDRNGDVRYAEQQAPARAVQGAPSSFAQALTRPSADSTAQEPAALTRAAKNEVAGFAQVASAEEAAPLARAAKSAAAGLQQSLAASQALNARNAASINARQTTDARKSNESRYVRDARDASDDVHSALESAIDAYMGDSPIAADAPNNRGQLVPAAPSRQPEATALSIGDDDSDSAMGAEMKAMRRILETQMAQLAWNDLTRRAPIHTEILRELTEVGLTQDFAAQIVAQLPAGTDITKARRLSIALMSQRLNVTGDRWLDKGGRIALVGPTGVGKTTALAKLAVRWVLRHGARSMALISADSVRIGAHDQMQALGQMLDVPVYVAESLDQIPKLLDQLGSQRFVLIDTPGMSQRDPLLGDRMSQIAESGHGIETALVLSASTQTGANAETVSRFATANIASVLLTKVDEAASLGGILSVIARAELPISYVSEGQRVPEDLRPARALELVSSAVHLAKTSGAAADEDLLRRRYGEVAHALA
jgi:flagellar biosynthesis protein FlhF